LKSLDVSLLPIGSIDVEINKVHPKHELEAMDYLIAQKKLGTIVSLAISIISKDHKLIHHIFEFRTDGVSDDATKMHGYNMKYFQKKNIKPFNPKDAEEIMRILNPLKTVYAHNSEFDFKVLKYQFD